MTYTEILGLIQRNTNTQNTTTSSYPIADKTTDVNNALNKFMLLSIGASGKWQVDDSNQTDYPIVIGNLVSGQQDYTFDVDYAGNQIMDIYRIEILDNTGTARLLTPVDQSEIKNTALTEFMNGGGIPQYYDKTANGIFLYPAPNYNSTGGLKIYTSRTSTYFTVSDTTKKAGIPWAFHEYLAVRPSYYYCLQKGLPQTANLYKEMIDFEDKIENFYSLRSRDEKQQVRTIYRSPR